MIVRITTTQYSAKNDTGSLWGLLFLLFFSLWACFLALPSLLHLPGKLEEGEALRRRSKCHAQPAVGVFIEGFLGFRGIGFRV